MLQLHCTVLFYFCDYKGTLRLRCNDLYYFCYNKGMLQLYCFVLLALKEDNVYGEGVSNEWGFFSAHPA